LAIADAATSAFALYFDGRDCPRRDTARASIEQERFFIQPPIPEYYRVQPVGRYLQRSALILEVNLSCGSAAGQAGIWYFVLALLASGLVFSAMIMILLEQTVLSRLAKLNAGVNQIRNSHNLSLRVPASGRDELAQLGHAVNEMLAELKQSEEAERRQRLTAEVLRHG
jgi:methyl-accepting chemotaxis protein